MAAISRAELIRKTLGLLGVVSVGIPPTAEDAAIIDALIDGKVTDLRSRGVINMALVDQSTDSSTVFDAGMAEWLAWLLAQSAASEFGKTADAEAITYAETQLKRYRAPILTGRPACVDYF